MGFPFVRLRRLRQSATFRKMVRQTVLSPDNFVMPLFVREGKNIRKPISSMPGQFQFSVDQLLKEVKTIRSLGIPAVILFGIPKKKDLFGSDAYSADGIIQIAVKEIKSKFPDLVVITDLCFCEYTTHGHCGVIREVKGRHKKDNFELDNDMTLDILEKAAVIQAQAGADVIAPSGMIDGMIKRIRNALDNYGYHQKVLLSYAAKYSSHFYGPFRDAAESPPQFGDRKTYQMDPANVNEAIREVSMDLSEGADIVMVKPALSYLDVIRRVKEKYQVPVAAYNVSGEYAMVKAAGQKGWIDEKNTILEVLTSMKRAGADLLLTYHAKEAAKLLN